MSEVVMKRCDECNEFRKDDTAKWWCSIGDPTCPKFFTFDSAAGLRSGVRDRRDYCSNKCLLAAFNRWMGSGSVEKVQMPEQDTTKAESPVFEDGDDAVWSAKEMAAQ